MMIVTGLCPVNATKKLRQDAMPDRPQPRARGRVVEHPDPARRAARTDALRPVPGKPRHRAQYADAAPERVWSKAGLLERRRYSEHPPRYEYVLTERGRDFRPVIVALHGLGQPAFRARRRERAARRTRRPARLVDPVMVDRATGRPIGTDYALRCLDLPRPSARDGGTRAPAGTRHPVQGTTTLQRTRSTQRGTPHERRGPDDAVASAPVPRRRRAARRHESAHAPAARGPIVPTLLRLAWPNILVMLAQASTGLIETWFVSRSAPTRSPAWRWCFPAS